MRKFRILALSTVLALSSSLLMGCNAEDAKQALSVASQVADVLMETEAEDTKVLEPAEEGEEAVETVIAEDSLTITDLEETESMDSFEDIAETTLWIDPSGTYDSVDDVALYLSLYNELPSNYISKKEAQNMGWSGGSLEKYAKGKCIGGSYFGNYEGVLPEEDDYHECDIDTLGAKSRGAKRIVYSNDGDIYYTDDHYETFTLLYTADGPCEEMVVYPQ